MKTEKEILFEQIRNNEVVLWLGAGFSIPAGYLSGNDLKAELYKNFKPKDQKDINVSEPLDIIASEYEAYYTRTGLINTLQKIFDSTTKKESKAHQLLARFTFFDTIITTNYDSLIEDYIGSRIKVYYDDNDLPIDSNKAALLKIHGDFSHTNSLVITKEDYAKIMDEFPKTLLYNSIIERLTNQNILFVGYSLEDINALSISYKINSKIGSHRKRCYIVSPSLNTSKIKRLEQQGIIYINSDGENFMNELEKNILDNAWKDYLNNPTNKALVSYLHNNNMGIKADISPNGAIISNVYPLSGKIEQKLELEIDSAQYTRLIQAQLNLDKIEIPVNTLNKLEYRIQGILFPLITQKNINKFFFQPAPTLVSKINIAFTKNDFEILEIPFRTYQNKEKIRAELDFDFTKLIVDFHPLPNSEGTHINVSINRKKQKFAQTYKELRFYQLLDNLANKEEFIITSPDSEINFKYTLFSLPQELCDYITSFKNFFSKLRVIEKKYNISFENYKQITTNDMQIIHELYSYTQNFSETDEEEIDMHMLYNQLSEDIMQTIYDGHNFIARFLPKTFRLLNKNVSLDNMRVEIHNPNFLKQPQYGKDVEIVIRAKKKNIKIY